MRDEFTFAWLDGIRQSLKDYLSEAATVLDSINETYLTYTDDTSNKFHFFAIYKCRPQDSGTIFYVGGNAYGRIGATASGQCILATGTECDKVLAKVSKKIGAKQGKGYVEGNTARNQTPTNKRLDVVAQDVLDADENFNTPITRKTRKQKNSEYNLPDLNPSRKIILED